MWCDGGGADNCRHRSLCLRLCPPFSSSFLKLHEEVREQLYKTGSLLLGPRDPTQVFRLWVKCLHAGMRTCVRVPRPHAKPGVIHLCWGEGTVSVAWNSPSRLGWPESLSRQLSLPPQPRFTSMCRHHPCIFYVGSGGSNSGPQHLLTMSPPQPASLFLLSNLLHLTSWSMENSTHLRKTSEYQRHL